LHNPNQVVLQHYMMWFEGQKRLLKYSGGQLKVKF